MPHPAEIGAAAQLGAERGAQGRVVGTAEPATAATSASDHNGRTMSPLRTLSLMAVGVVAVSLSGPVMASMVVPPLAISFWRNGSRRWRCRRRS